MTIITFVCFLNYLKSAASAVSCMINSVCLGSFCKHTISATELHCSLMHTESVAAEFSLFLVFSLKIMKILQMACFRISGHLQLKPIKKGYQNYVQIFKLLKEEHTYSRTKAVFFMENLFWNKL